MKKFICMLAFGCLVFTAAEAQKVKKLKIEEKVSKDQPGKKVVRIEKDIDGETFVTEEVVDIKAPRSRVYTFKSPSDGWQIDTVINGERELKYGEGFSWEEDVRSSPRYKRDFDRFRINVEDFTDRLSRDLNSMSFNDSFSSNEGFSNVNIFTNKPSTHVLNLKFRSAEEGQVSIAVVNLEGELVTKETVKDFKGEYVGQLHLKEGTKGTFFVIISQGDKGISRKVKID